MADWFLYMLLCSDNSIYTGITTNTERRVTEHNNKKGARSLFGKLPVRLVYTEKHNDQISAAKREREIKSLSHKKKILLIGRGVYPE